jgi:hypothetical protein
MNSYAAITHMELFTSLVTILKAKEADLEERTIKERG